MKTTTIFFVKSALVDQEQLCADQAIYRNNDHVAMQQGADQGALFQAKAHLSNHLC
jgi:hypothetical protein